MPGTSAFVEAKHMSSSRRRNAGSRLGHYFHTVDSSDGPQQKLILIRLADVPRSDAFASLDEE